MLHRDIIVVGASAGGVEALSKLVSALPSDFPGTLFVVNHFPGGARSLLPEILSRHSQLPAAHARPGQPFQPGHIYVAPPDFHMSVADGTIDLSHGPKENGVRPAIDVLFRSAARDYGPRVIGILLSGYLSDGSLGLMAIKAKGGMAIVQDPQEALASSMPLRAMEVADIDFTLPARDIALKLEELTKTPLESQRKELMPDNSGEAHDIIQRVQREQENGNRSENTTYYTCPDCGGVMWQVDVNGEPSFVCHTGHIFSTESLMVEMSDELEEALWTAVRMMKERSTLARQTATRARERGSVHVADWFENRASRDDERVDLIINRLLENDDNSPAAE